MVCNSDIESNIFDTHLAVDHSIHVESKTYEFCSVEEFITWKSSIEIKTKVRFVKNRGSYDVEDAKKTLLICSRNGYFKSKSNNLRRLKLNGSIKINGYCPAKMHITEKKGGNVNVVYTKTHIGHAHDSNLLKIEEKDFEELNLAETNSKPSKYDNSWKHQAEILRNRLNRCIDDLQTAEELETINKICAPIEPIIKAMRSNTISNLVLKNPGMSKKKNITIQRRLFSTKKKKENTGDADRKQKRKE